MDLRDKQFITGGHSTIKKVVDDVKWLKKFFWLTFSTGLGALATAGFLFIQFLANT